MACRPPAVQCKQRNAFYFFTRLFPPPLLLFFPFPRTIALLCPLCAVHLHGGPLPGRVFSLIYFSMVERVVKLLFSWHSCHIFSPRLQMCLLSDMINKAIHINHIHYCRNLHTVHVEECIVSKPAASGWSIFVTTCLASIKTKSDFFGLSSYNRNL